MKSIVFGGTGFIGSHVVEQLQFAGHEVTVAVRSTSNTSFLETLDVCVVPFDPNDLQSISNVMGGHEVVYNCTADNKNNLSYGMNEVPVEIILTKRLIEAAARTGVRRFLQLSSIVLYDFQSDDPIDETYQTIPEYPIQKLALERERVVLEASETFGMKTLILRPASTIGVRDVSSFYSRMLALHLKNQFPFIRGGTAKVSIVDTRDIGRAMAFLAEVQIPNVGNDIFLLKGYDTSWEELKGMMDKVRGVTSSTVEIPETLSENQVLQYGLTPFTFKNLSTNRVWNDQKIRDLGFSTQYSLDESVHTASLDILKRNR